MKKFLCSIVVFLFVLTAGVLSGQEWNGWRGPNHDGKSLETGLIKTWPEEGPSLLWKAEGMGSGYANLSFWGDKMFTEGDFEGDSYLLILNRADAKVLHQINMGKGGKVGGYDGPKSTPATDGKYVYALNQKGFLLCAEVATGKTIWQKSFHDDFGAKMPANERFGGAHWGFACSPVLDGDRLVCMVGGDKGTVVALNKTTGETIWVSEELTDASPYISVVPTTIDGVWQYLTLTEFSIAGLAPETGKVLWKAPFPGKSIVCTDPVCEGGIVFTTCAYGVGSYAYQVKKKQDKFQVEQIYDLNKIDNKHHGLIIVDNHVYTTTERGSFACVDLKSGEVKWEERRIREKASISFADGNLILRKENTGELILVKPDPEKYDEIGRFQQPTRSDKNAWTYPIVVDKKMYVRDQDSLFCYDLSK